MQEKTCCFFGHRKINETEQLKSKLCEIIEKLIVEKEVDTFLFGSKSEFNSLCLKIVTKIKEKYPHIKRVYVRAEYPDISEQYTNYLLESYEDTYYPEHIISSGRATYVERNYEMINKSHFSWSIMTNRAFQPLAKAEPKLLLTMLLKGKREL